MAKLLLFLAVILSVMPYLRIPGVFITLSDLLFFTLVLLLIASGKVYVPQGKQTATWWICGSMFIVIGLLACSLFSIVPLRGIIVSVQYIFALLVIPLLVTNMAKLGKVSLWQVTRWFLLGMLVVQLVGCVLYYSDIRLRTEFMIGGRMSSLLENPNTLGEMTGLALPFSFYLYFKHRIGLVESITYFVVDIAALAIAASFGGIITAVFSLMIFSVVMLSSRTYREIFLKMCFPIFLVLLLILAGIELNYLHAPAILENRVMQPLAEGESLGSQKIRLDIIMEAIGFIMRSPIVGVGADGYQYISQFLIPVHNTYLLLWAEGGILSFIGIIMVLIIPIGLGWLLLRKGDILNAALLIAVGSAFSVACMANTHIYARFWFFPIILAISLTNTAEKRAVEG